MSPMPRYAAKQDQSSPDIVKALRENGVKVWLIGRPCDLLVRRDWWLPGIFGCLELKTPSPAGKRQIRHDQQMQDRFLASTRTPVALTPEAALEAVEVMDRMLAATSYNPRGT